MLKVIGRRIVLALPVLLTISFITFILMWLAPGDFLTQLRMDPTIKQSTIDQLKHQYGLDKPPLVQYFIWLKQALMGNLGYSYYYRVPVSKLIGSRVIATLILSFSALIFSWVVGITLGITAALHKYTVADQILTIIAFSGIAIPGFFLALLLQYMAATTGWLPITGMHSAGVIEGTIKGWPAFVDLLRHLILPTFTLAFGGLAGLMRYARGTMLDVLNEDYVIFARAKGLPENKVIYKHALRNAINPLVTMLGYSISGLLGGAVITETIFGWPGLGRLIYQALMQQDIYLVMASTIINTIMLIVGNFIADILLAWVDPRVRLQMGQ